MTAASAERSGTAVVRMTHDGRAWAGKTVRWNGDDIAIAREPEPGAAEEGRAPRRRRDPLRLEPEAAAGSTSAAPTNIDPGSGTTPAENLAAVREDVGGATLRRITAA